MNNLKVGLFGRIRERLGGKCNLKWMRSLPARPFRTWSLSVANVSNNVVHSEVSVLFLPVLAWDVHHGPGDGAMATASRFVDV